MNNQNKVTTIVNSKYYSLLLFFVSFVFVTLFSRSTSFLYVFEGFDAAIFKQMGLAVLKGKTLYVDYFDNKGCILYFIQALGLYLGGNFFILIMQAISLTITLIIWNKTIAFYREDRFCFVSLGIALFLLLCFYDGGDLSEEWCLPFASYPIFLYFRSLKSDKEIRRLEWFVIGICFGIIAFIRINNASAFLGFIAFLFISYVRKKEFKKLFYDLFLFILGTLLISGICFLYFYLKAGAEGIIKMFYGTFLSYFNYFNTNYFNTDVKQKVFYTIIYILFLIICITFHIINTPKQKEILIPTLISYAFFICSSGTRCYTHYLMALLPLIIVGIMTIKLDRYYKIYRILAFLTFFPLLCYIIKPIGFFVNDLVLNKEKAKDNYSEFHRCIEEIPLTERDSIYNYNLSGIGAGMMQHENLLQCNKVFYSLFAFKNKRIYDEVSQNSHNAPRWVLFTWNRTYFKNDAYFILNNYDLYCEFTYDNTYLKKPKIGNNNQVYLYRRKD